MNQILGFTNYIKIPMNNDYSGYLVYSGVLLARYFKVTL